MFERFTDRARSVLVTAQEASIGFGHKWLGCEHILLGLLAAEGGVSAVVLEAAGLTDAALRTKIVELVGEESASAVSEQEALAALGIDLDQVRQRLEATFGEGALPEPDAAHPPFTPLAKGSLERARDEAIALGHTYIGTEHLLLGLLAVDGNVGLAVLRALGVDERDLRQKVLELVAPDQLRLRAAEAKLQRLVELMRPDPDLRTRVTPIYQSALKAMAPARIAEIEARSVATKALADAVEAAVAEAERELGGLGISLSP
jgi:ATP-dependent Clp protease ATP-binding subunit ClpC